MQQHTQAGCITTNLQVKIDFTLPELSAKIIVTWGCHVDGSAKIKYEMILGKNIFTALKLNIKFSDHVIESDDGTFKGLMAPIVDLGTYEFKALNIGKNTPKQQFTNSYAEEIHELEQVCTYTKILCVIFDCKQENVDLNNFMENQCQHLTETQRNNFLKLLQKFEELFEGKKQGVKPIRLILYPVPTVH